MKTLPRIVPWIAVGLATVYLIMMMRPPSDDIIRETSSLLVVDVGRFKPIDSYARTQMMLMNKRQTYTDAEGETQPALRWLLDAMAMGLVEYYHGFQIVTIDDPEMVRFLELQPHPRNLYAIQDIIQKPQFKKEVERVFKQHDPRKPGNDGDGKVMALALQMIQKMERLKTAQAIEDHLTKRKSEKAPIFRIDNDQVLSTLQLKPRAGFRYSWSEIRDANGFGQFEKMAKAAGQRPEKSWNVVDGKAVELYRHLQTYREVERLGGALLVPPVTATQGEDWSPLNRALMQAEVTGVNQANATALENLLLAYGTGNTAEYNKQLAAYQQTLEERYPDEVRLARLEAFQNNLAPFYQCTVLYILICVLVLLSWVAWGLSWGVWSETLNRTSFWLLAFVFVVHTIALIVRMYLQDRPPVTNLYSSAIFIGWGAVALCLGLERIFKIGVSTLVGAALGFLTTFISHHLATSGDTLEMMQAVLDTNFWLATHVTCITLGYTATYVAGMFAILYVVAGVFTPWLKRKVSEMAPEEDRPARSATANLILDRTVGKALIQMIYGVVCFATLLSFVGTVLGGVWADQSWGRFWGWDPKENGALLIVAMNALILHARWSGIVRDRGMAVLAMTGNMITLWSWFGTNQLGIGLHAYGVNKTLIEVCRYGWLFQMGLIGVGLLPLKYWRSHQPEGKLPTTAASRSPRVRAVGGPATAITR